MDIYSSTSYSIFKKKSLNYVRPCSKDAFNVYHPKRLIVQARLRVGVTHLREHKFKHSFLNICNPICFCGFDIKTFNHFFPHCPRFTNERENLLLKIDSIIVDILRKTENSITSMLLYNDPSFSPELNINILYLSID